MAEIKTFAAVRPKAELSQRIAALPYDVYSREEAREQVEKEPLSFLSIDRGETGLGKGADPYGQQAYEKARETYLSMKARGMYVKDECPCFYLYELTWNGRCQTGLVALASVDDYLSGIIRKHENTRKEKEDDRTRHVDTLNAQTGPIFLAYRKRDGLEKIFREIKQTPPIFDFVKEGGVRHRGFRIADERMQQEIKKLFGNVERAYIADGHHRAASAVRVALKRRKEFPDSTGEESFNYFLSVFFPDDELEILDYNRILKNLGGMTEDQLLKALEQKFEIQKEKEPVRPREKGEFGLYLPGSWYRLKACREIRKEDPVEGLDVSLLQREVFEPLFQIKDPRSDPRIDFVGGIRGLRELERRVGLDAKAAFSMFPTSMEELFRVADSGALMPPKSTWFEPKLLSGLFIHEL